MISEYDVYCSFRRAQAISKDRGYRIPKNWDDFLGKMNHKNAEWLYKMMSYFNTTYSNIDLDEYMKCGFELWKGFTYKHFCDGKIIDLYIQKDKIKKRKMTSSRESIDKSFAYVNNHLDNSTIHCMRNYTKLHNYCKLRDGQIRRIIKAYNSNDIDSMLLVYCIHKGYIDLIDDERSLIPYIVPRYRELRENMLEMIDYIKKLDK